MRRCALIIAGLAAAWVAGCDNQSENLPPQGGVRTLNAVPDLLQASVLIANPAAGAPQINQGTLAYASVTPFTALAVDNYPVEILVPEDWPVSSRTWLDFGLAVKADVTTTVVLTGSAASPQRLIWDNGPGTAAGDQFGSSYGHAGPSLGPVDIYVEPAGAGLAGAMPEAGLSFSDYVADVNLDSGSQEVFVTPPGDPNTVLFRSAPLSVAAGANLVFAVLETAGLGASPLQVIVFDAAGVTILEDVNTAPRLRVAHNALNTGNADFVVDAAPPLAGNVAFQTVSDFAATTPAAVDLIVTEAGNPGAIFAEQAIDLVGGSLNSTYLLGQPGSYQLLTIGDNRRPIAEFPQLRVVHGASNFSALDLYLLPAGTAINLSAPLVRFSTFPQVTSYLTANPGTYDLVLTESGTLTELARLDGLVLNAGGTYSALTSDNVDPNVVDVVLYDDFP